MVQEQRYLLGIDLGTTGVKSLLLDADGLVVGSATAPLGLAIPSRRHGTASSSVVPVCWRALPASRYVAQDQP